MVGWHPWLNGHEFEQAPGNGEGQGSLVCCSPGGLRQSDTTESEQQQCCHFWRHKLIAAIILSVNNDSPKWATSKWKALSLITCTGAGDSAKSQIHVWTVQALFSFQNHMLLSFQDSPLTTCGIIYMRDSTVNPACLIQWFRDHFLIQLKWFHKWPWTWGSSSRPLPLTLDMG